MPLGRPPEMHIFLLDIRKMHIRKCTPLRKSKMHQKCIRKNVSVKGAKMCDFPGRFDSRIIEDSINNLIIIERARETPHHELFALERLINKRHACIDDPLNWYLIGI